MNTNERPTKEVTLTQTGAVVTLYTFITGRDKRSIEAVYLEAAEVSTTRKGTADAEVEINGVKGTATHHMTDAAFKVVVKSVRKAGEGAEEITEPKKICDFILDEIPESDYNEVVKAVNEITDPKKA